MSIEFLIDYFRITIHLPFEKCIAIYDEFFQIALGDLSDLEHGAKGFKRVAGALQGFQLKHNPPGGREYCTFEFPGQTCGCVAPEQLQDFYYFLKLREYKINVTRLDLAFDNVPFSPGQVYEVIWEDASQAKEEKPIVRSLTERRSVNWISQPLQFRDDLSGMGCDTCYFGKRSSMRFLRVYNKRGPTRLELELKEERANLVADSLFLAQIDDWPTIAKGHLLDFIDIDRPWWKEFIGDTDRAYKKLHYAKDVSLEKSRAWLLKQVSPALSAVAECTGGEILLDMDKEGRKRMNKRYGPLISAQKSLSKGE
jgi:DNA relaxase NicK